MKPLKNPWIKSLIVGVSGTTILGSLHRLLDPSQCAAFLNVHSESVAAVGGILSVIGLWIKSPGEKS